MRPNTPLLIFVVIIPILTELLTSNIPFPAIFAPVTFLFLVLFYSAPILIIRELAIRYKLSIVGLFLLGLAYGFLNEGVVARTLFLTGDVMFMESYRIYDMFGVNIPWVFFMVPWHALCAVLYPIVLVGAMYPDEREASWLSTRKMWVLGSIVAVIGSVMFFNGDKYPIVSVSYLIFSWVCIALLVFVALRIRGAPAFSGTLPLAQSRRPFIYGVLFSLWLLGAMVIGGIGWHWIMHVLYALAVFWGLFRLFLRKNWLNIHDASRFALGHYVGGALMTAVYTGGSPPILIGEVIVLAVLYAIYQKIKKNERPAEVGTLDAPTAVS